MNKDHYDEERETFYGCHKHLALAAMKSKFIRVIRFFNIAEV